MPEDTSTSTRRHAVPVESRSRIEDPTEVTRIALGVDDALIEQLEGLEPTDWQKLTECAPWTVHDMVAHLVGAAYGHASIIEGLRQIAWGLRHRGAYDGSELDAMNELQVREHRGKSSDELVTEFRAVSPRAVRVRAGLPKLLGRIPIPLSTAGSAAEGMPDRITFGELNRVIYTRDAFMHRIDIARATGRELVTSADVDRRVVEDVVIEWCARHQQPVEILLSGPVGGRWSSRGGGELVELDAIEFCRILSGRAPAEGLLTHRVLF